MTRSFIRISCSPTAFERSTGSRWSSSACESTRSPANTSHWQSLRPAEASCPQDEGTMSGKEKSRGSARETAEARLPSDQPTPIHPPPLLCSRRLTWTPVHRRTTVAMHDHLACPSVSEWSSRSMSAKASASSLSSPLQAASRAVATYSSIRPTCTWRGGGSWWRACCWSMWKERMPRMASRLRNMSLAAMAVSSHGRTSSSPCSSGGRTRQLNSHAHSRRNCRPTRLRPTPATLAIPMSAAATSRSTVTSSPTTQPGNAALY